MPACRICLRDFILLKFDTEHIGICEFCVSDLNEWRELACFAQGRLGDLLRKGMANRDPNYTEDDFRKALPAWFNRLLADKSRSGRDYKILRAYRRNLLRDIGVKPWEYPSDWSVRAQKIRKRDECCRLCGTTTERLDVHHIIYLSNWGTNQQNNLVSLCRPCHENVHGRAFDWGEADDPENTDPIKPQQR
ncbi:HNH endonuclease [compost metagenome]